MNAIGEKSDPVIPAKYKPNTQYTGRSENLSGNEAQGGTVNPEFVGTQGETSASAASSFDPTSASSTADGYRRSKQHEEMAGRVRIGPDVNLAGKDSNYSARDNNNESSFDRNVDNSSRRNFPSQSTVDDLPPSSRITSHRETDFLSSAGRWTSSGDVAEDRAPRGGITGAIKGALGSVTGMFRRPDNTHDPDNQWQQYADVNNNAKDNTNRTSTRDDIREDYQSTKEAVKDKANETYDAAKEKFNSFKEKSDYTDKNDKRQYERDTSFMDKPDTYSGMPYDNSKDSVNITSVSSTPEGTVIRDNNALESGARLGNATEQMTEL